MIIKLLNTMSFATKALWRKGTFFPYSFKQEYKWLTTNKKNATLQLHLLLMPWKLPFAFIAHITVWLDSDLHTAWQTFASCCLFLKLFLRAWNNSGLTAANSAIGAWLTIVFLSTFVL